MNQPQRFKAPLLPLAARFLIPVLALGAAAMPPGARGADADKPYNLFAGANVEVGRGSDLKPVIDISDGSWVVLVDGKTSTITPDFGPVAMKVTRVEKLTKSFAQITGLKGDKAYTFANDPSVRMTRNMNQSASVNVGSHAAVNQANSDANGSATAVSAMGAAESQAGHVSSGATSTLQTTGYAQATIDATSTPGGAELFDNTGQPAGDYDAVDVSFSISADHAIGDPFLIVISRFKDPTAKETGGIRELRYAKALAPIGPTPAEIKFEQAGFPPGFVLESFEIHLYDAGTEIATNVAPGWRALTSDQAFDYVKGRYLASHKEATLGATPVLADVPKDLAAHLAEGKYAEPIYVKVSKDGLADTAFADAACSKPIDDPYLASVVRTIRFKPALSKGEPVEGTATLKLSWFRS
jgi:hypothetical protein